MKDKLLLIYWLLTGIALNWYCLNRDGQIGAVRVLGNMALGGIVVPIVVGGEALMWIDEHLVIRINK